MADKGPVIGIDLGTTNSVVAAVQGGQPAVIPNRTGQNLTPSVVAVSAAGKLLVGPLAKRQAITNPEQTVYASKRLIGRKYSSAPVQKAVESLPYRIVPGEHDDVRIPLGGRPVSLPEISAAILRELKLDAEAHFGVGVTQAVVTVPAYFNDGQRQATKDAGAIAGLEILRLLNEPTAAALAYGFGKGVNGKIAVYDLGGGTFDVSVLEVNQGVFDVVATGGDSFLGGEDFDNRIIDWLVLEFAKEHGVDLRKDRMALQRLKEAAERAKIELSSATEAHVNLPFLITPRGAGSALHLQATLTRAAFEAMTADLCERTLQITQQVLSDAKVRLADLREVILVGGMTRMPKIAERVRAHFHREPCRGVHPEEVVALGAAVQAQALMTPQSQVLLLDVTPQSLGVAVAGGYTRTLIPRNTTVPTAATERFHTSKDLQSTVKIIVLQGEHALAEQNELLGEFTLSGLREAARGQVEVEVTFDINAEGIVAVSAKDTETGQRQSITVAASGGLTEEELRKILSEQGDYLLQAKGADELKGQKERLTRLGQELGELLPMVRRATEGKDYGSDALAKAEGLLAQVQEALAQENLALVTRSIDQVARAQAVLQSILARAVGTGP